ncbi:MAG: hypothetical protein PHN51_11715 [Candidatus Nanopelagicales bacterium]|nr:hypothetical protein [Candidatus Nanopelagicales bacterium]
MAGLYKNQSVATRYAPPVIATEHNSLDTDFEELRLSVKAYCSTAVIMDAIAAESYFFVRPDNRALVNAYTALLGETCKVPVPAQIAEEAFQTEHVTSVNAQFALEGWMGDIWQKIKNFFKKIYDTVAAFLTKHFTRLGIVKKRLQNIKTVLSETDKEIDPAGMNEEEVTSGFQKKYVGHNEVNTATVGESIANMKQWMAAFVAINTEATQLSKSGLVGPGFISHIKALKEKAKSAGVAIDANNAEKGKIGALKGTFTKEGRAQKADIKESNKTLSDIQKDATKQAADADSTVDQKALADAGTEDANAAKVEAEFKQFMEKVSGHLMKVQGKVMINGFRLKEVTIDESKGVQVVMEDATETPGKLTLGGKIPLTSMCNDAIEIIEMAENSVKNYSAVNDEIMKQLKNVDALIADIDKVDPAKYGKYRNVLSQQVQKRLKMLQAFFQNYNQVGKNVYTHALETGEGYVEYATLSLKHFA